MAPTPLAVERGGEVSCITMDEKKSGVERERDRHTLGDEHGVHVLCVWKTLSALKKTILSMQLTKRYKRAWKN